MKNLELKLNDEFKEYVVSRKPFDDLINPQKKGITYRICFPEVGYGASVIKHFGSHGYDKDLWELALLSNRGGKWELEYTDLVNGDVIGYLTDEQVNILLGYISKGLVHEYVDDLWR